MELPLAGPRFGGFEDLPEIVRLCCLAAQCPRAAASSGARRHQFQRRARRALRLIGCQRCGEEHAAATVGGARFTRPWPDLHLRHRRIVRTAGDAPPDRILQRRGAKFLLSSHGALESPLFRDAPRNSANRTSSARRTRGGNGRPRRASRSPLRSVLRRHASAFIVCARAFSAIPTFCFSTNRRARSTRFIPISSAASFVTSSSIGGARQ